MRPQPPRQRSLPRALRAAAGLSLPCVTGRLRSPLCLPVPHPHRPPVPSFAMPAAPPSPARHLTAERSRDPPVAPLCPPLDRESFLRPQGPSMSPCLPTAPQLQLDIFSR